MHRIWEVAHSVYGEHSPKARQRAEVQTERIEEGHPKKVLHALRFLKAQRRETQELIDKLRGYLQGNLDRMDYPEYRRRELRVRGVSVA